MSIIENQFALKQYHIDIIMILAYFCVQKSYQIIQYYKLYPKPSKLWVPRSNRGGITNKKPPTCSEVLFCVKSACEENAGAFGRLVRRRRQAGASAPSESEQPRRDHQNKASDLFGGFVLREIRL